MVNSGVWGRPEGGEDRGVGGGGEMKRFSRRH